MDASTARIGFIGFGNMAQAMAKGLVEPAGFAGGRITACAAHFDKLEASCKPLGANAVHTPAEVAEASDLVIAAAKPYMVADVLTPARAALAGKAVVSVAAGLLFDFYEDLLGAGSHHLSTIPNTPIAVGCGVLACERYEGHMDAARAVAEQAGFVDVHIVDDLTGRPRVLVAKR